MCESTGCDRHKNTDTSVYEPEDGVVSKNPLIRECSSSLSNCSYVTGSCGRKTRSLTTRPPPSQSSTTTPSSSSSSSSPPSSCSKTSIPPCILSLPLQRKFCFYSCAYCLLTRQHIVTVGFCEDIFRRGGSGQKNNPFNLDGDSDSGFFCKF